MPFGIDALYDPKIQIGIGVGVFALTKFYKKGPLKGKTGKYAGYGGLALAAYGAANYFGLLDKLGMGGGPKIPTGKPLPRLPPTNGNMPNLPVKNIPPQSTSQVSAKYANTLGMIYHDF